MSCQGSRSPSILRDASLLPAPANPSSPRAPPCSSAQSPRPPQTSSPPKPSSPHYSTLTSRPRSQTHQLHYHAGLIIPSLQLPSAASFPWAGNFKLPPKQWSGLGKWVFLGGGAHPLFLPPQNPEGRGEFAVQWFNLEPREAQGNARRGGCPKASSCGSPKTSHPHVAMRGSLRCA